MVKKKVYFWLLFGIVLVGAYLLRIGYINFDFWYDEACSWAIAKQDFPFGIIDNLLNKDMQHTPLYFMILHFWMKIFGTGEVAIKSLSLIFGLGTVPLVYSFAKKITEKKIALWAMTICAVSPLLVYFSTEARMYSMVVFLVVLSLNYLVDFEQKNDTKSLIKLVAVNILIPYTLVGAILYNISLWACYLLYLYKQKREIILKYLKGVCCEVVLLLPFFALIGYYAKIRASFIISHEGNLLFSHVIEVIKNFFGLILSDNIYWPLDGGYSVTFVFTVMVIIPCIYFIYGFIQGYKNSNGFLNVLYKMFLICFLLSVFTANLKIHIYTMRYFLYILPPILTLSIIGLKEKISDLHMIIFLSLFTIFGTTANFTYKNTVKPLKTMAFKSVSLEAQELELGPDDIVIMPFGADAPYYFRKLTDARIYDFDYHKQLRNPYNDIFYDKNQQKQMASDEKYKVIYDSIFSDRGFSDAHYDYFKTNVSFTVPRGRYVLLALYGDDAASLVSINDLRKSLSGGIQDVKRNIVGVLFKKYLIDIRAYLDQDFNYLGATTKNNYTYLLYQKR